MVDPVIEVIQLRKTFKQKVAVDDVSFSVPMGTVFCLLGPNGAGKTTTINCVTTLLRPDGGRVVVAGHDVVTEPAEVRRSIALTGQFAALDDELTGWQNLVLFGRLLRLGKASARVRANELLARFDLEAAADQRVKSYSGGMRRRLDLAASLTVERPVLVLDEPTTGLDPRSRQEMWGIVRDLRASGVTILLTTQYLEEVDKLGDQIVVIDSGRVIATGTPDELKTRIGRAVCEVGIEDETVRVMAFQALAAAFDGVVEAEDTIAVPAATARTLTEVVRIIDGVGLEPDSVGLRQPSLDDVFLALTGDAATAGSAERKAARGAVGQHGETA